MSTGDRLMAVVVAHRHEGDHESCDADHQMEADVEAGESGGQQPEQGVVCEGQQAHQHIHGADDDDQSLGGGVASRAEAHVQQGRAEDDADDVQRKIHINDPQQVLIGDEEADDA